MTTTRARTFGEGVYYADGDYPGYARRVSAILVDLVVLGLSIYGISSALEIGIWPTFGLDHESVLLLTTIFLAWGYLAILKASPMRTIGYRLMGLKIVNLKGERPSVFRMTFRMSMWLFGPLHFLIDLLWISMDTDRQSLRDCFAGTYVVRNTAVPIGPGPVYFSRYAVLGFALTFPRVRHAASVGKPALELFLKKP